MNWAACRSIYEMLVESTDSAKAQGRRDIDKVKDHHPTISMPANCALPSKPLMKLALLRLNDAVKSKPDINNSADKSPHRAQHLGHEMSKVRRNLTG